MAKRRMFSLDIVDSDAFLDMPQSSQNLYFHLAMRADDDGFVSNPKKIMRTCAAQDDDYKVLIAKRFIIPFESGICVIKHWKIHNYIQKDRYKETLYIDEKEELTTKDNGSYTECIQNVSNVETQVRLGKVRKGKESKDKDSYGESGLIQLTQEEYDKLCNDLTPEYVHQLIEEMDDYLGTMTPAKARNKYASHYKAIRAWARKRLTDYQQKKSNKRKIV